MKQYTTEWARERLRKDESIYAFSQDKDGTVAQFGCIPEIIGQCWMGEGMSDCKMLEHPDGWQKSLVTREDI